MICKWEFLFLNNQAAIDRSKYQFFPISWITYIRAAYLSLMGLYIQRFEIILKKN